MQSTKLQTRGSILTRTINLMLPSVAALLFGCAASAPADPGNDNRAPEVPASLAVPDGNKVSFHAYAVGVQIYGATASTNSPNLTGLTTYALTPSS